MKVGLAVRIRNDELERIAGVGGVETVERRRTFSTTTPSISLRKESGIRIYDIFKSSKMKLFGN